MAFFHGAASEVLFQTDTGFVILHPGYSVQQFLAALGFHQEPIKKALLRAYLSPAQVELFQLMPVSEQRHAFAVLRALQKGGHTEPILAQAALLHDIGKVGGRIRFWHRVVAVMLQAIHPTLLSYLGLNEPGSWRYPFFVLLHHASLGAEMAVRTGTDSSAVTLIRWHHTTPEKSDIDPYRQALLTALRAADEKQVLYGRILWLSGSPSLD